jgi:hypothetical protein
VSWPRNYGVGSGLHTPIAYVFDGFCSMIGMAERGLDYMVHRSKSRLAFGKQLSEQGSVVAGIAQSRCEVRNRWMLWFSTVLIPFFQRSFLPGAD